MSDIKEEWEIGYTRENPKTSKKEPVVLDFNNPVTLIGQHLDGRFLIEKNLTDQGADAGGIGIVFLARDMKLMGRKAVVKILQKNLLADDEIARKFQHEKEALIRLDHPNIVRILDSGNLLDGNPFLVMEYISGHSLRRRIRETNVISFDLAAHIVESVSRALGSAHAKKILHRDIKPENIMLTPQESGFDIVKLIDFGIARVEESKLAPATTVSSTKGSIYYIAPEQLAGNVIQTPAVDIYSFSVVIYEILTGKLPFQPVSIVNMYELQKDGVRTPPSHLRPQLTREVEKLLLSGLEYDETERPRNIHEFGLELASLLRNLPTVFHDKTSSIDQSFPSVKPKVDLAATAHSISSEPVSSDQFEFRETELLTKPRQKKSKKPVLWALLAVLLLAAFALPAGIIIWNLRGSKGSQSENRGVSDIPTTNTDSSPNHSLDNSNRKPETGESSRDQKLSYFLVVQKMRDGKPFETPFQSSGQETLESGYKFKLVMQPDADGFMYVYNEGNNAQNSPIFSLLFPTPSINNGSSRVTKSTKIETAQNTLGGGRGTEVMWLIWTKEKKNDLEEILKTAIDERGVVNDENSASLRRFIQEYKTVTTESVKDSANQRTLVNAKGEIFVHRFELEHR